MDLPICGKQENVMMPKVAVISKSSPPLAQPPDLVLAKPPEEAVLVLLPKTFSHQVQAIKHEEISSDPELVLATADIIENPVPMHGYLLAEEPMSIVFPTTISVLSQVEEQSEFPGETNPLDLVRQNRFMCLVPEVVDKTPTTIKHIPPKQDPQQ